MHKGSSEWFLWGGSVLMTVVVAVNWWRARVRFHRDVPKTNYSGFMSRFAFLLCLLGVSALAAEGPEFDDQGRLKFPANYREWIFLSSGLGMTYGPAASAATAANPLFDNVFVNPPAWAEFKKTGKWPEGTVFVLEIRKSTSNGSINKGGHFQSDTSAIEVEVKDTKRYPRGWAFYDFRVGAAVAAPLGPNTSCHGCHSTNGAVENTFVQFYPTALPIAKAKGTVKADVKETN